MRELSDAPRIITFLENRGLDPAHATRCGVKALDDVNIAYPLWNGQWKIRNVETKSMMVAKMGSVEKPLPAVFGTLAQFIDSSNRTFHIHLTEGETDALALSQVLSHNFYSGIAVAVPGVNGISAAVELLKPMLGDNIHITIYPDADEPGQQLRSAASSLGAYVVDLPKGKDICEFLGSIDEYHRWDALQVLRHHAASYVPFEAPVSHSKSTPARFDSDVPEGVRAYFQRMVSETVSDEHIGYSEVEKVCCPWHTDPKPSLSIDWNRCIWYCHGCGIGGGVKRWKEMLGR